jgi:hypothetical protein
MFGRARRSRRAELRFRAGSDDSEAQLLLTVLSNGKTRSFRFHAPHELLSARRSHKSVGSRFLTFEKDSLIAWECMSRTQSKAKPFDSMPGPWRNLRCDGAEQTPAADR